jgi:hypothetical protein
MLSDAECRPSPGCARAVAVRTIAFGLCGALAACGDGVSDPQLTPAGGRASLGVQAVVQSTSATAVELRAGYLRANGQRVELSSTTVALDASSAQRATMTVELTPCLADAQRAVTGPTCDVQLEVRLLRNTTQLDVQTVRVAVKPGDAASTGQVVLYEAQTVRVGMSGSAPSAPSVTSARVEINDTLRLSGTAVDATGAVVAGHVVQWTSANPSVARVDAASGLITGVSAGTTTIAASAGTRTAGQVNVTVAPPSVRTLVVSPASVQLSAGQTRALAVTAQDVRGSTLAGRAFAFSSSDARIATVSAAGVVSGVGVGSATVTVSSAEGPNGSTVTASVPVTVMRTLALTLTKSGSGDGTLTASPAQSSYAAGSVVALTAVPDAFSYFAGWSGAGCGRTATCAVTLTEDQSVVGSFGLQQWNGTWATSFGGTRAGVTSCGWTFGLSGGTLQVSYSAAGSGRSAQVAIHAATTATPTAGCNPDSYAADLTLQGTAGADGSFSVQGKSGYYAFTVTGTLSGSGAAARVSGTVAVRYVLDTEATTGGSQVAFTATPQLP